MPGTFEFSTLGGKLLILLIMLVALVHKKKICTGKEAHGIAIFCNGFRG